MPQLPCVTLPELAAATGRSEEWWKRNWLKMHQQNFFPRRLPGLWGWPRSAVEAWLEGAAAGAGGRGGSSSGAAPADHPANDNAGFADDMEAATRFLEARFGIPPQGATCV